MKYKLPVIVAVPMFILLFNTSVYAFGLGFFGAFDGGEVNWGHKAYAHMALGGGFALDTNLAADKLFNYRLDLSVHYTDDEKRTCFRMNTVHYFGFGVVRKKIVRFWLGPQLSIGGMIWRVEGLYAGLGLALGLNLNLTEMFTMSFTLAPRFIFGYANSAGGYGADGMFTIGFMFRVGNDTYDSKS